MSKEAFEKETNEKIFNMQLSFVASSLNFLGECTTVECLEVTISKFELYSFCCIQQPVIAMAASSLLNFSMESLRCG